LPITLAELEAIVWRSLQKPPPAEGVRWCACMGAEPMVEAIKQDIRALVAARLPGTVAAESDVDK
jgi:hypothetical protein